MSGKGNKALFVLPTGVRGGAEAVCFSLIKDLSGSGWSVDLLVMSKGLQPELERMSELPGIRVISQNYGSEKSSLLVSVFRIYCLAKANKYKLVYSTHLHVSAMLGLMRKIRALPCQRLVVRESTVIFDRFFGVKRVIFHLLYRVGYGAQNLLIAQTPEMLTSLAKYVPHRVIRNARVVPNPIDISSIASMICDVAPVKSDRKRIVACGRLVAIKGFSDLIDAFKAVVDDFPDYDLEIIGGGEDEEGLRDQVKSEGLHDRVFFHGQQKNPWRLIAGADIGVISSRREGFPNVLLEMMACRVKRVVATPCTQWVSTIPDISVSRGVSAGDIAESLRAEMLCEEDRSASYRQYLEEIHSLRHFTDVVVGVA